MVCARSARGFTLIELLVVIAIIIFLFGTVAIAIGEIRAQARDRQRIGDVASLELALAAYAQAYGNAIDCPSGLKIDGSTAVRVLGSSGCADGSQILNFLQAFLGSVPHDPRGPDNNDYYYYFDADHSCVVGGGGGYVGRPLLFAVNLERKPSNILDVCDDQVGGEGGLMSTQSYGGSIQPSVPYVVRLEGFIERE